MLQKEAARQRWDSPFSRVDSLFYFEDPDNKARIELETTVKNVKEIHGSRRVFSIDGQVYEVTSDGYGTQITAVG